MSLLHKLFQLQTEKTKNKLTLTFTLFNNYWTITRVNCDYYSKIKDAYDLVQDKKDITDYLTANFSQEDLSNNIELTKLKLLNIKRGISCLKDTAT